MPTWLVLRNTSGKTLTDVTLFVDLHGWHGKEDRHLVKADAHMHFVRRWPAGETIIAPYPSSCHEGIASTQSVEVIQKVDVHALSGELHQVANYTYVGKSYDNDLMAFMEKASPEFYRSWYRYDTNYFVNDGLHCFHTSNNSIAASGATLKLPSEFKEFRWKFSDGVLRETRQARCRIAPEKPEEKPDRHDVESLRLQRNQTEKPDRHDVA